ncbi:MAG: baseplate J/gp47 family protein [Ruminococcus sp.]|nr:baseplate J/gp47 family protein [Ruminococcus sp.]
MDSYEDILSRMKEKYTELSGRNVPELSDIDIRMKVLAGEIYNDEINIEFIKRQMFATTATGEYLDYHAQDRGLKRKGATKAVGTVKFSVNEPAQQSIKIPKGTVVATSGKNSVRFITDVDDNISIGNYSVSIPCTAQEGGASGNVSENSISVMVTHVVGIDSVTNTSVFTSGSDIESDELLRRRVLDTYKSVSNGTNKAYYKRLALSVEGVNSVNVVPKARGTGTVDVYIAGKDMVASPSIVNEVNKLIAKQREINVDVKVSAAYINKINIGVSVVLKEGYDLETVRQNIKTAVSDYIDTLEVGDDMLEKYLSSAIINAEGVVDFSFINMYPSHYITEDDTFVSLREVFVEEEEE